MKLEVKVNLFKVANASYEVLVRTEEVKESRGHFSDKEEMDRAILWVLGVGEVIEYEAYGLEGRRYEVDYISFWVLLAFELYFLDKCDMMLMEVGEPADRVEHMEGELIDD